MLLSASWETFTDPTNHTQWHYFCRTLQVDLTKQ